MNYITTKGKLWNNVNYPKCEDCEECSIEILKNIRRNNVNRVVIGHKNINSIRNKFDMLSSMLKNNTDILMISETKLVSSFPQAQFRMERYVPPFRYYRNSHGGGILLFIREHIPKKIINITLLKDFEGIFVELNFFKEKVILCCSCNPHKNLISNHLNILGKTLNTQMKIYDNFFTVKWFQF